jgi:hypothetical protein
MAIPPRTPEAHPELMHSVHHPPSSAALIVFGPEYQVCNTLPCFNQQCILPFGGTYMLLRAVPPVVYDVLSHGPG